VHRIALFLVAESQASSGNAVRRYLVRGIRGATRHIGLDRVTNLHGQRVLMIGQNALPLLVLRIPASSIGLLAGTARGWLCGKAGSPLDMASI
jgi:hypothetical protein